MILCVDIGNTSIKLARVAGSRVTGLQCIPSRATAQAMARAVERVGGRGVEHAVIASVRPQSTASMQRVLRAALAIEPLVVTHRTRLPVTIAARRPAHVGIDRLCAASGAVSGRARNAIVVDAGTAITVDLVLDRCFLGGLIMPGPQVMLSAMHRYTARLPDLRFDARAAGRFDDTVRAMQTGARTGSAGAIVAAVRLLRQRAGGSIPVFLTGGYAPALRDALPRHWRENLHLVFLGMVAIARLNPPRS